MKRIHTYIKTLICASIILSSCTRIENNNIDEIKSERIFSALIQDNLDTKTIIDGELGDQYRKTLWLPNDSIAVTTGNYSQIEKFYNVSTDTSEVGIFRGEITNNSSYFAIYPYNSARIENDSMFFVIPETQMYYPGSFSPDAAPMFARTYIEEGSNSSGSEFTFTNLCGVLVINLTGEECVKNISFTSKGEDGTYIPISGRWSVDINYQGSPTIKRSLGSSNAVTIECGDEGVQLDPTNPTPFYMVLPPATYSNFMVSIATTDGKIMIKESTKPLTISRANVTKTSALEYAESIDINLSERGTSNCYIVSEAGIYSFDASVIGNGTYGISEYGYTHTTDVTIEPSSVEVLWMDRSGIISNTTYNAEEKTISFISTGIEGNALIAAKNESGEIIWSWHIWCTDEPVDHKYINYNGERFTVQDRNLGATRADRGTDNEWIESTGLFFQWGRKDPINSNQFNNTQSKLTIEETVLYPTIFPTDMEWMANKNKYLWTRKVKTIYDPCPIGYKVANRDVWTGFSTTGMNTSSHSEINIKGTWDNGFYFIYDGTNAAWYPAAYNNSYAERYGGIWYSDGDHHDVFNNGWDEGNDWTCPPLMEYYYNTDIDASVKFDYCWAYTGSPYYVRCMLDEGFVDARLPEVVSDEVVGIDSHSAKAVGYVNSHGESDVTARGFVWSKQEYPKLGVDKSVEVAPGDEGFISKFEAVINGLESGTTYYIRPYATSALGTGYGKPMKIKTKDGGSSEDVGRDDDFEW